MSRLLRLFLNLSYECLKLKLENQIDYMIKLFNRGLRTPLGLCLHINLSIFLLIYLSQILPALLETYASGSIEPWYTLLCTRNKPKLKRKRKPEQAPQLILLPQHKEEAKMMIKPDICGE